VINRIRARYTPQDSQAGQALVEFALVLPILLTLLLGIVEFARVYNYWNEQTNVANIGARYAAVGDNRGGTLASWLETHNGSNALNNGSDGDNGVQGAGTTVCIGPAQGESSPETAGSAVTVVVTSQFRFIPFLERADVTIKGKATQRLEVAAPSGVFTQSTVCS